MSRHGRAAAAPLRTIHVAAAASPRSRLRGISASRRRRDSSKDDAGRVDVSAEIPLETSARPRGRLRVRAEVARGREVAARDGALLLEEDALLRVERVPVALGRKLGGRRVEVLPPAEWTRRRPIDRAPRPWPRRRDRGSTTRPRPSLAMDPSDRLAMDPSDRRSDARALDRNVAAARASPAAATPRRRGWRQPREASPRQASPPRRRRRATGGVSRTLGPPAAAPKPRPRRRDGRCRG